MKIGLQLRIVDEVVMSFFVGVPCGLAYCNVPFVADRFRHMENILQERRFSLDRFAATDAAENMYFVISYRRKNRPWITVRSVLANDVHIVMVHEDDLHFPFTIFIYAL